MLSGAVFLLSLSSLCYEILLARFFSIAQWNHFSFMIISIALLGFASSGIFLHVLSCNGRDIIRRITRKKGIYRLIVMFSLSVIISYLVVNILPTDYFRIPFDPLQVLFICITFLILALPFFFSGLASAIAYAAMPEKAGIIYCISMAGSTLGAAAPLLSLPLMEIGGSVLIAGLLPLSLCTPAFKRPATKGAWILCILILVIISFYYKENPVIAARPSPYKTLPQLQQLEGTKITQTIHTIRGKIDRVESPSIRYIPGLSLHYSSRLPRQYAVIQDADTQTTYYNLDPGETPEFPAYTLPHAGYVPVERPVHVLILQKGGGTALPLAIASSPGTIIVCENNPSIARQTMEAYGGRNVTVINQGHREYIIHTALQFDIIHIENWGTSLPGMASLSTEYLYTLQAMKQYIKILSPRGVLIIPRKLLLPPSDSLRIFLSALKALDESGIPSPQKHIMMVKHWDIYTLLLSKAPFSGQRLQMIKDFCSARGFDLLFYDGITMEETEKFVVSSEPYHYNALNQCLLHKNNPGEFISGYFLDIAPQTDARPYHNKYVKWGKLPEFYKSTGRRGYALILSGEIIVWVVFGVALIMTSFILILPALLVRKKKKITTSQKNTIGDQRRLITPTRLIYFLALGAGFMFTEIVFINEYTLTTGDPVISFSFVLCLMLVVSGIGGYFSSRIDKKHLISLMALLTLMCALLFLSIDILIHFFLVVPVIPRYILMALTITPVALLMGVPFPWGMAGILTAPHERASGWAANGCTSVLASIIAVPLAMTSGIHILFLCGGVSYGIALVMFLLHKK